MITRSHAAATAVALVLVISAVIAACSERAVAPAARGEAPIPAYSPSEEAPAQPAQPPVIETNDRRLEEADYAVRWLRQTIVAQRRQRWSPE